MELSERITLLFDESIKNTSLAKEIVAGPLVLAPGMIVHGLLNGHKILACGSGDSAPQAQHFAVKMMNGFERARPSLPVIALTHHCPSLTAMGEPQDVDEVFAKQIRTLGQPGDILLAIDAKGQSPSVLRAVQTAHEQQMPVIALTGDDGGQVCELINEGDVEIRIPSTSTARVQETHLLIVHCLCDLIDTQLLGN